MSGLMAVFSIVLPTGMPGFLLTTSTCVNEVTVVFAQIGDDSVIEKATTQAREILIEKATEKTMEWVPGAHRKILAKKLSPPTAAIPGEYDSPLIMREGKSKGHGGQSKKNVAPFSNVVRLDDSADGTLRLHLALWLSESIFSN